MLNVKTVHQNETSSGSRRPLHTNSELNITYSTEFLLHILVAEDSTESQAFIFVTLAILLWCVVSFLIFPTEEPTNTMNLLGLFLNGYQYHGFLCLVYIFLWVSLLSNANSLCETSALLCTSLLWKALHTQNISNEISSTTQKKKKVLHINTLRSGMFTIIS